jgi:hypothetical protein
MMEAPTWTVADGDAQRQDAVDHGRVVHVQRGDGLRDAAALGAGENVACQEEGGRQAGGCDDER